MGYKENLNRDHFIICQDWRARVYIVQEHVFKKEEGGVAN